VIEGEQRWHAIDRLAKEQQSLEDEPIYYSGIPALPDEQLARFRRRSR
jgi:hypothetical protein